jgi:hypothetical protein
MAVDVDVHMPRAAMYLRPLTLYNFGSMRVLQVDDSDEERAWLLLLLQLRLASRETCRNLLLLLANRRLFDICGYKGV